MSSEVERFGSTAILKLNIEGFNKLSLDKKHLVYHLSQSGLYGRDLYLKQNYEHNHTVKQFLETLYKETKDKYKNEQNQKAFENLTLYLKDFWVNVGIYNDFSNKILDVFFNKEELQDLIKLSEVDFDQSVLSLMDNIFFNPDFTKKFKNIQEDGIDIVSESGGNFYKDLNNEEVKYYRSLFYPKCDNQPQFGFNSRLVKKEHEKTITQEDPLYEKSLFNIYSKNINMLEIENNKTDEEISQFLEEKSAELLLLEQKLKENEKNVFYIEEQVIFEQGLYGEHVKKVIKHLELALKHTENENQFKSIKSLIKFYKTGDPKTFDEHSLEWVKDQESEIFFINGLIESYADPKGVACTFESIVAFKNKDKTEKVNKIIENIQYFENNMPVDKKFKKTKATGLSASSVTVAGMSGATSPCLPLGICLPNSDWIREQYGSKSVNLYNVHNSRENSDNDIKEEFFLPEYLDDIIKYGSTSSSLHTDLHEVAGHGSCKNLEGVSNEALDLYYSVIEEARADLVGLYFINDKKLVDFGVLTDDIDLDKFGKSQYISYITNGSLLQLRRVELGANLAQPHLRNRQLICNWVLEQAKEDNCVELVEKNGKMFVVLNDFDKLKNLFGILLGKIQEIKSTGDFNAAKDIVEKYGTLVDYAKHEEVIKRVEKINPPSLYGFTTPIYTPVLNDKGEIIDYEVHQKESFIEDQLYLSKHFS